VAASGGRLYASHGGRLYGLDAATGAELWQSEYGIAGEVVVPALTVSAGGVYLLRRSDDVELPAVLHAVDAGTGAPKWQFSVLGSDSGYLWPPAVSGGAVYYCAAGVMYALDAATGRQRWSISSGQLANIEVSLSRPTGAGSVVYLIGPSTHPDDPYAADVAAVDARTGRLRWTRSEQRLVQARTFEALVVSDGHLLTVNPPKLVALDAATGKLRWSADTDLYATELVTVAGHALVGPTLDRAVIAVDARTGRQIWRSPLPFDRASYGPPAIAGRTVYVAGDGGLRALDLATGVPRWTLDTGLVQMWGPAADAGVAYAFAEHAPDGDDDYLYAVG
jgi:eukaryotic-like serine/threonine-protein kinase